MKYVTVSNCPSQKAVADIAMARPPPARVIAQVPCRKRGMQPRAAPQPSTLAQEETVHKQYQWSVFAHNKRAPERTKKR